MRMTDEADRYGKDAAEWLRRWDEEGHVWSIEMGGLGPGYEQALQIAAVEMLRWMLATNVDTASWETEEGYSKFREERDAALFKNEIIKQLGLSGAQWGAAGNLATNIYTRGPAVCFADEAVNDRLIQVSKSFPAAA
jgi:hypothetical protein